MKNQAVIDLCESLALKVTRGKIFGHLQDWDAVGNGHVRVYWQASTITQELAGMPRVSIAGVDTHTHSLREVQYLITHQPKDKTP